MQLVVSGLLTHFIHKDSKSTQNILILHGWGHNSQLWQSTIDLIPDSSIYALDLPSFGNTQNLNTNHTPGVQDYAAFVIEFIHKSHIKTPIILIGHSFGGQIAVEIAITHPKLISKLILISPALIRSSKLSFKSKLLKLLKPLSHLLPTSIYHSLLKSIASKDYLSSSPNQKKILSKIIHEDYSNKLSEITEPTHIIWGSEDKAIPYHGKTLAEKIKDCSLTVLYGAGHNPHLTHQQKLADTINLLIK